MPVVVAPDGSLWLDPIMTAGSAVLFVHTGRIPFYLKCAMESARVFNPYGRIVLLTDAKVDLRHLKVEVRLLADHTSPELDEFRRVYQHISATEKSYERFCFERWFCAEQFRLRAGLERMLMLDSDCVLFAGVEELFGHWLKPGISVSRGGSPHCAFIMGSLQPFLEFTLMKFRDEGFLSEARLMQANALASNNWVNLTDMTLFELYAKETPHGVIYPNTTVLGHLDHNINSVMGGFVSSWRFSGGRKPIKRVFWEIEQGKLVPYLCEASSLQRIRALTLHFQAGAKRMIGRFNCYASASHWPMAWKRFYLNHVIFPPLHLK